MKKFLPAAHRRCTPGDPRRVLLGLPEPDEDATAAALDNPLHHPEEHHHHEEESPVSPVHFLPCQTSSSSVILLPQGGRGGAGRRGGDLCRHA